MIIDEIRAAYGTVGIALDQPATYGTYYRLVVPKGGRMVGNVGDRLLPGMARELVDRQSALYAMGLLGCACGTARAEDRHDGGAGDVGEPTWPLWRRAYAAGDPLPRLTAGAARPQHRFDEGEALPEEYRALLLKMLRHEGERAGNKSFLGFMATCLDLAESLRPPKHDSGSPAPARGGNRPPAGAGVGGTRLAGDAVRRGAPDGGPSRGGG